MAVGSDGGERSLEQTPTWAVAVICSAFVITSLLIEHAIHHVRTMGSHMKNTIFEERKASGLRRWHRRATKNKKNRNSESGFSSRGGTRSVETTPSHGSSPLHLMRRYNTMGDFETPDISARYHHSEYNTMGDIETPDISPRYYHSEYGATESPSYSKATEEQRIPKQIETSNLEIVASSAYPPKVIKDATEQHSTSKDVNINSRDFSFDKF